MGISSGGKLILSNNIFSQTKANTGGVIFAKSQGSWPWYSSQTFFRRRRFRNMDITGCTFESCNATYSAGIIAASGLQVFTLSNSTISSDSTADAGTTKLALSSDAVTVDSTSFSI